MRCALCVLVLVAATPAARADNLKDAQAAMKRGVAAQQKAELEPALAEFQEAIRLVPEAPVPYRYAGETLEQLGRYQEAVTSYETYLRLRPESADAATVKERIDKIRRERLEGTVDIPCTPKGAEVLIDGAAAPAGTTPLKGVQLAVGKHSIFVRAPGYSARTVEIEVAAGTAVAVACDLERVPPPIEQRRRAPAILTQTGPPDEDEPPRWYSRWWVWAGAAAVVGGAAAVYFVTKPDLPDTDGGDLHFP